MQSHLCVHAQDVESALRSLEYTGMLESVLGSLECTSIVRVHWDARECIYLGHRSAL